MVTTETGTLFLHPDRNLAMELVRATEAAAIRATPFIGHGDKLGADGAAVDAMRKFLGTVNFAGTVVIGADVQISTVGISHGSLSIEVRKRNEVSQPYPFSLGGTVPFDNTEIEIAEESGEVTVLPGGVSIGDLAKALNAMGVSPRDLASIFQALKAAGALNADIIVQ